MPPPESDPEAPTQSPSPTPELSTPTLTPTEMPAERVICSGGEKTIAILVDPGIVLGIRSRLDQFEMNLCGEIYSVVEKIADFAEAPDVRDYLLTLYQENGQHLVGAILIGEIPYAYQMLVWEFSNPDIAPFSEEVISYQYYADLDGSFYSSPEYVSPGGHSYSFDIHEGNVDWEIWIGVMPTYLGNASETIQALNRYFEKNNNYRSGAYEIPRAFLAVDEHISATNAEEHATSLNGIRSGDYSWEPFSSSDNAYIYFNSESAGLSVAQGYEQLSRGVADFFNGSAHGSYDQHGSIDVNWVESNPINTVFFWSDGCSVGNLDFTLNLLSSVLYSPTSKVLFAKGTTNASGGMGTNENGFYGHNIAMALSQGKSMGEAILFHVNTALISPWSNSRENHYAPQIFLGDPTLKLQP